MRRTRISEIPMDVAPWGLSGIVYGTLLNQRGALAALGPAASASPYLAPPRAPVLYLKPRNTLNGPGGTLCLDEDVPEVEVGATLGIVLGRTACRVAPEDALGFVAGYTIVNDFSVPHASCFRPAIRCKARDGSCCIGPAIVARVRIADPDALGIRVYVDGELVQQGSTRELIRPVRELLADVTEFMTLQPGDVLLAGVPPGAPRVRAGQDVAVEIDALGRLENRVLAAVTAGAAAGAAAGSAA